MAPESAVIVPAVLGVGVLFSLATLLRDLLRRLRGRRWLERRSGVDGVGAASTALAGQDRAVVPAAALHRSVAYLVVGIGFAGLAIYGAVGSYGNYIGWTRWAAGDAWLWCLALLLVGAFGSLAAAALSLADDPGSPPPWVHRLLARTPLGRVTPDPTANLATVTVSGPRPLGSHQVSDRGAELARWTARIWSAVAVVGLGLGLVTDRIPRSADPYAIDDSIAVPVQQAFLLVVAVGVVVAFWRRLEALGAALMALGAALLGGLAAVQHPPEVAVLVTAVFAVPAFGHWLAWQRDRGLHHLVGLALLTTSLIAVGYLSASAVEQRLFGPTHPDSTAPALPPSPVDWVWAGGTTSSGTTVVAGLPRRDDAPPPVARVGIVAGERWDPEGRVRWSELSPATLPDDSRRGPFVRMTVDGLEPDTTYAYAVEVDGVVDTVRTGRFRTFPDGPADFRVAFASCARSGSNAAVFDAIAARDPLLYLNTGDFHYANIGTAEPDRFRAAIEEQTRGPGQSALYRSTSFAYVWDDHDYGANDADRTSPSRAAAQQVYRELVPHHPLPGDEGRGGSIQQAFDIGRVRFLLTDNRSFRDPASAPDGPDKSLLGAEQRAWFEAELRAAARDGVVVAWVNPTPWIAEARAGSDSWAGYAHERGELARLIDELDLVDRFVMLSGDAHMLAFDDGTHTNFAGTPGPGFPVLHAAALDRPGGIKGGPYSGGTFPGSGQYGELDVTDDGSEVTMVFRGRTWEGTELITEELRFPLPSR